MPPRLLKLIAVHAAIAGVLACPAVAAGPFVLTDDTGEFTLAISGKLQFRYTATLDADGPERLTHGFMALRTEVKFKGAAPGGFEYSVTVAFKSGSSAAAVNQATISRSLTDRLELTLGQFKVPLVREYLISSSRQLTVGRSVMNAVFNQSRSQGIGLKFAASDRLHLAGAISDGIKTKSTMFTSAKEADIALTGRAELRLGEAGWEQFADFTSFRGGDSGVLLGLAGHWQSSGNTGFTAPAGDIWIATADISVEGGGWNAFAAGVWRRVDLDAGGTADDFGAIVQGGVFVSESTEVFARWDAVFPDSMPSSVGRTGGADSFTTITCGLTRYLVPESHAAKLTVDVMWFVDSTADSSSLISQSESIGLLESSDPGEVSLRVQMQLLF